MDIDDPRIQAYRPLKKLGDTFVSEGMKLVEAVLRSPLEVLSFFAEAKYHEMFRPLLDEKGVELRLVGSSSLMREIVGYKMHRGCMALAKVPKNCPLEMLEPPICALDGLANGENVGAIVRSAAAFGIGSLLVDSRCSPPYLRRTVKVSMGCLFDMQLHVASCLTDALRQLPYPKIGADLTGRSIVGQCIPKDAIIVFGNEGAGISENVGCLLDDRLCIPMEGAVDSLNAASAASIFFYQLRHFSMGKV